LSVYALAEDPNPQNHRWKKNQHLPVPARFAQPAKSSVCDEFQGKFKLKLCCQIESCLKPSLLNSGQQYTSSLLFKFMLRVDFRFSLELHGIDSIIMLTLMGTAVIKQLQQVGQ
jgi:hypothetical protein